MQTAAPDKADWLAARVAFLAREKAFTRERDALAEARRALPALKIDKHYVFDTTDGPKSLGDLFAGRSQLMLYHFMYGADWPEGCASCSFWADNLDGIDIHLAHRDVTFLMVSTAPLAVLKAYRARMSWRFDWVSCAGNGFNRDMNVSFTQSELDAGTTFYNFSDRGFPATEAPGLSVFRRDGDGILLTYGTFGRGTDGFNGAYHLLDLAPKGRDEDNLPGAQSWVRRHDQYED